MALLNFSCLLIMKHLCLGRLRFGILNNWLVSVPQSRLSVLSPSSILLEKLAFEQPEYSRQVKKETTFTSSLSCMSGFGQFSLNAWIGGEHLSRIWSDSMPGFSNVRSSVAFNCVVLPVLGGIPARVERGREMAQGAGKIGPSGWTGSRLSESTTSYSQQHISHISCLIQFRTDNTSS